MAASETSPSMCARYTQVRADQWEINHTFASREEYPQAAGMWRKSWLGHLSATAELGRSRTPFRVICKMKCGTVSPGSGRTKHSHEDGTHLRESKACLACSGAASCWISSGFCQLTSQKKTIRPETFFQPVSVDIPSPFRFNPRTHLVVSVSHSCG